MQQDEKIDYSEIAIFVKSKEVNNHIIKLQENGIPALSLKDENISQAGDAVRVSTLHSSKGLEFRAVIILDAEKNLMDFKCNNEKLKIEISAKLLYVGMTRAYDCLFFIVQKNYQPNQIMQYIIEENK